MDWQGTIHVKPAFHTVWDHNIPFPLPSEAFCPAGMDATKMDKMLINAFKMLEEKGQQVLNTVANCIDDWAWSRSEPSPTTSTWSRPSSWSRTC